MRILVFSQYVEAHYARGCGATVRRERGYLLKDRIADVSEFVDALELEVLALLAEGRSGAVEKFVS